MKGLGDVKIREASTIRFIQALTAGVQAFLGVAGVSDALPAKATLFTMAAIAGIQVATAFWNSGLHNEPAKSYEPPKL